MMNARRSTLPFLFTLATLAALAATFASAADTSAADIHSAASRVVRHHVVHEPPVLIDARRKPSFPKELATDPDTAALVSRRWREYFPDGRVQMGDSDRAHLDRG